MEIRRFGVGNRRPDGPPGTTGIAGQVIHSDGRGVVSELAFARRGDHRAALQPEHDLVRRHRGRRLGPGRRRARTGRGRRGGPVAGRRRPRRLDGALRDAGDRRRARRGRRCAPARDHRRAAARRCAPGSGSAGTRGGAARRATADGELRAVARRRGPRPPSRASRCRSAAGSRDRALGRARWVLARQDVRGRRANRSATPARWSWTSHPGRAEHVGDAARLPGPRASRGAGRRRPGRAPGLEPEPRSVTGPAPPRAGPGSRPWRPTRSGPRRCRRRSAAAGPRGSGSMITGRDVGEEGRDRRLQDRRHLPRIRHERGPARGDRHDRRDEEVAGRDPERVQAADDLDAGRVRVEPDLLLGLAQGGRDRRRRRRDRPCRRAATPRPSGGPPRTRRAA